MTPRVIRMAGAGSLLLLVGLLTGCGGSAHVPPPSGAGAVTDKTLPAAIRSLPLHDATGHTTTLGSFPGKVLVVSDSMTLCTEDCPLDTANIVSAARAADAAGLTDRVEFLTITVDPQRDTPRRLTAYRKLYDSDDSLPNWQLLTGTKAQIAQLWNSLGVFFHRTPEDSPPDRDWLTGKPLTYDVAHSDDVLAFDGHGHERWAVQGHADVPKRGAVPAKMRAFLTEEGHRHLDRPGPQTWSPTDVLQAVGWLTGHRIAAP